jgi:hypothetical protein
MSFKISISRLELKTLQSKNIRTNNLSVKNNATIENDFKIQLFNYSKVTYK